MGKEKIQHLALEYDGIKFRSILERDVYKTLKENGFLPKYEPEKVVLFNGFKPQKSWFIDGKQQLTPKGNIYKIKDWTYTPDFTVDIDGIKVYIEVKGHPNDVYPYKRKLFLKYIDDKPAIFFEVKTIDGLLLTINKLKDVEFINEYKREN